MGQISCKERNDRFGSSRNLLLIKMMYQRERGDTLMVFALRGYVYYLSGKFIAVECYNGKGAGFGAQGSEIKPNSKA